MAELQGNFHGYPSLRRSLRCFLAITLIAAIAGASGQSPACAWWFFHKKKPGDAATTSQGKRKARPTKAVQVGLVPGNPPALYWKPSAEPRAALLCLHELGLYKGVFDDLGQRMSREGVAVYAIDLRGFGDWQEAKEADAKMDLSKTLADVKGSVEILHKLHPNIPVFVLGEAMGGALALEAAAKFPDLIQGTISAAPGGEHFNTASNYIKVTGHLMTARVNKDSGMSEELMQVATPKAELREALQSDEKVRLDLTPRELMACQFYMYKTKNMARQIKDTPVLIVHGEQDGESRPIGSTRVYERLATRDKKFLSIPDGDHYTFEDTKVSDLAMKGALSFIDEHLSKKTQ